MAEITIAPVATHGFFMDGRWIDDGDVVEVHAPYDGSLVGRVIQARREHAEAAIAASVKGFGTTKRLPAFERQRVLRRIAQQIGERRDEFSATWKTFLRILIECPLHHGPVGRRQQGEVGLRSQLG